MKLSIAINGFILSKTVAGASKYTIRNYQLTLRRLSAHLPADPHLADVTAADIRAFLHQLMTTQFAAQGCAPKPPRKLSAKTLRNIHTCLSSLWTWALAEGYANDHIVRAVDAPQPETPAIQPFDHTQIKSLLKSLAYSVAWSTSPDTQTSIPKRRQLRDRAIILFLLDTGVRASELCQLTTGHVDLIRGSATVTGKGRMSTGQAKKRVIHFGAHTRKAIWQYLAERDVLHITDCPLFTSRAGQPLTRDVLYTHLHRLGQRANVHKVHPHRFRHTFAITYLRNGGDIFTLQRLLGHASLEMVRRYLSIAQVDVAAAHRRASPVDNWNL